MELNTIFYEKDYSDAFDFVQAHGGTCINEIERDEQGRRFQIQRVPQPTEQEMLVTELAEILQHLVETDYVANKLIEAIDETELSTLREQYADVLMQRRVWRARASELKDKIENLKK